MSSARRGPIAYDMLMSLNLSVKPDRRLKQSHRRAEVCKDFRFHQCCGRRSGSRHPRRAASSHSSGNLKNISRNVNGLEVLFSNHILNHYRYRCVNVVV